VQLNYENNASLAANNLTLFHFAINNKLLIYEISLFLIFKPKGVQSDSPGTPMDFQTSKKMIVSIFSQA
jgi:hypothetical protein